jgi:phosphoglycolate phosphatase-like HAD superfamily hydrolase
MPQRRPGTTSLRNFSSSLQVLPADRAGGVGDSIWDMLAAIRCRALGVGLLSGGYGPDELRQSGAFRVYDDPADLLRRIDEVGGRR